MFYASQKQHTTIKILLSCTSTYAFVPLRLAQQGSRFDGVQKLNSSSKRLHASMIPRTYQLLAYVSMYCLREVGVDCCLFRGAPSRRVCPVSRGAVLCSHVHRRKRVVVAWTPRTSRFSASQLRLPPLCISHVEVCIPRAHLPCE
jgi:hypothetical protein